MAKNKVELSVQGMSGDVRNIELTLGGITGVDYAHVNLGAAKITVEFDDSLTDANQLIAEVERMGYLVVQV
jgi:copper chaperone CopZ